MAIPTICKSQDHAMAMVMKRILNSDTNADTDALPGAGAKDNMKKINVYYSETAPATGVTGMVKGDLVIAGGTVNDIYRFISSNTYINITAES